ncbi:MAG: hypothetical protein ACHQ7M_07055, partial [Chloroflexota bacterium]
CSIAVLLVPEPEASAMPPLPFPESLCHRCDAPPRYIRPGRSVFILCPRMPEKYPRQPVLSCSGFNPRIDPTPKPA